MLRRNTLNLGPASALSDAPPQSAGALPSAVPMSGSGRKQTVAIVVARFTQGVAQYEDAASRRPSLPRRGNVPLPIPRPQSANRQVVSSTVQSRAARRLHATMTATARVDLRRGKCNSHHRFAGCARRRGARDSCRVPAARVLLRRRTRHRRGARTAARGIEPAVFRAA